MTDADASYLARGLTRRFPGVLAVDEVDLTVQQGEIHGLIGKNGAGKSVLVSMVAGLLKPSAGYIETQAGRLDRDHASPARAKDLGIALVAQEPRFAEELSVADNLFMGQHPAGALDFIDTAETRRRTAELIDRLDLKARPGDRMGALSIEAQQLLNFGRAVFIEDARIVLLDEITASLTSERKEHLLTLLKTLVAEKPDLSITLISHHVSEIIGFTDRVSVMRDGKRVATLETADTDAGELSDWIVGDAAPVQITHGTRPAQSDPPLLEARGIAIASELDPLDLDLHCGEVLGFAGLEGSGKDTAIEALYGLQPAYAGSISVNGTPCALTSPKAAQAAGISFLPKHRERQSVIQNRSVLDNVIIAGLPGLTTRLGFVRRNQVETSATGLIDRLNVKTPGVHVPIDGLSGGNKQKVLIGRLSLTSPRIILMNEPTRGVDISAKPEILRLIREDLARDAGIVVISESEEELVEICDRVIIFYRGRAVRTLTRGRDGFDVETIYKAIQGVEIAA